MSYQMWLMQYWRHLDPVDDWFDADAAALAYPYNRARVDSAQQAMGSWSHLDAIMLDERLAILADEDAREYARLMRIVERKAPEKPAMPPLRLAKDRASEEGISRTTEWRRRRENDAAA